MTRRITPARIITSLALVVFLYAGYLGVTLVQALTNPGYGVSLAARSAEWGHQHGFSPLVTWSEAEWYRLHPPVVGGVPPAGSFTTGVTTTIAPSPTHLAAPTPVPVPTGLTALPGEGVWRPVGRRLTSAPGLYVTSVRPDAVHTSYVVGLAWMDPTLLTARLYSGSTIPGGGPYRLHAPLAGSVTRTLVAAFNAGFRFPDAQAGDYTDHHVVVPLRVGAASAVIYANGVMSVGQWGRDMHLTPQVVSVRQNLDLIVDAGHPVPGLLRSDNLRWGATLGGSAYVWRSGLGVTASGALIYAAGPSLSIVDLASVLAAAGCVRAMELDINPDWTQFSYFSGMPNSVVSGANGTSLLSGMLGTPSRYFAAWWSRDFFTMSLRSAPLARALG